MTAMRVWSDVLRQARQVSGIAVLTDDVAAGLSKRFAESFIADPATRWWWESIRERAPVLVEYGDGDAWEVLRQCFRTTVDSCWS